MEKEKKEKSNKKCLKDEIKRIVNFYKKNYTLFIIIVIFSIIIVNIESKKEYTTQRGGGELKRYLLNLSILDRLKEQFPLDKKVNYIMVGFGYFLLAFVVRPIRGFFIFILILFAISGSFLFPFLIFGAMLYFVIKKTLTNKNPSIEL